MSSPKKWTTRFDKNTGIYETIYKNGLKLLTMERSHLPIVTIMLWYRVGSIHCLPGQTGIAHLIEHLMFKGTSNLQKGEIDLITQKLGGTNNAFTSGDYTCYYFCLPSESWKKALYIEADRMLNCKWTPEEFQSEKNVILNELGATKDSPFEVLARQTEEITYQRHPYRYPILGWEKDLREMSLEEVYDYYKKYYRPNNAVLVIIGDIENQEVVKETFEVLGKIKSGVSCPSVKVLEDRPLGQKRLQIIDNVNISRFTLLFHTCVTGSFDDYVLDLIDIILSSGRSSRFFRKLVLEKNTMQSIQALNDTRKYPGLFWIYGELTPGISKEVAEEEICQQLKKLQKLPVGQYELERAKNIFRAGFVFEQETNYDLAYRIGEYEMLCGYKLIGDVPKIIQKINAHDIQKVAKKYLNIEKATFAWSIPKKNISMRKIASSNAKKIDLRGIQIPKHQANFSFPRKKKIRPLIDDHGKLNIYRKRLKNGMTFLGLQNSRLPAVSMGVYCYPIIEKEDRQGGTYLLGRLLAEGTQKKNGQKIARIVEFLGASLNTTSSGFMARVFKDDVEVIMDLVSDIIQNPAIPYSALQREKKKVITQLMAQQDSAHYQALLSFRKLIYGNHPYSRPVQGNFDTVPRISVSDLLDCHQKRFQPKRSIFVMVGDISPRKAYELVEKYFGNWKNYEDIDLQYPGIQSVTAPQKKFIQMDKEQMTIYWGHLGIKRANPDYYKLVVLDHILGEGTGFTDRLSKRIRDELGLCYSIECSVTSNAGIQPGTLSAFLTTKPNTAQQALEVLVEEIDKVKKNGVTAQELEDAKSYLCKSLVFALEENDSLVSSISKIQVFQLGFDYIGRFHKIINSITLQDIQEAARKYLHPEIATTVIVGKESF